MGQYEDFLNEIKGEVKVPERVRERFAVTLHTLPEKEKVIRFPRKSTVLAAALAIAFLGTVTTGAAVYSHFTRGFANRLSADEETRTRSAESGLSVNPATEAVTDVTSATDQGITVTAAQSIVDRYTAYLSFQVYGYELPDGAEPGFGQTILTVDGEDDFNWSGGFYDGIVMGEELYGVYEDGSPLRLDADGRTIFHYYDSDGALEYQVYLHSGEEGFFLNKEIDVTLLGLGTVEKATYYDDVNGKWSLHWTLSGSDESRIWENLSYEIEDTGIFLTEAEVTPISFRARIKVPENLEFEELADPIALTGVKLRDGTLYPYLADGGSTGWIDKTERLYQMHFAAARIIEPEEVTALLFWKTYPDGNEITEENFYVVPLE